MGPPALPSAASPQSIIDIDSPAMTTTTTPSMTQPSTSASPPAFSPSDTDLGSAISSTLSSSLGYGKSWAFLPENVVSRVLDFVYDQYQAEPPTVAENAGPWDLAEQNEQQINTRVFWNHIRFTQRLQELEKVSASWANVVSTHWAWTWLALPQKPLKKAHTIGKQPADEDEGDPRTAAEETCWLCGLYVQVNEDTEVSEPDKLLVFQDLGKIPVCKFHSDACRKCTRFDDCMPNKDELQLQDVTDLEFFPKDSPSCEACRAEAVLASCDKVGWIVDDREKLIMRTPRYAEYFAWGWGTAREVVQQAGAHAWLSTQTADFEDCFDKRLAACRILRHFRQSPDATSTVDFKHYEREYNACLKDFAKILAEHYASMGIWLSAEELLPGLWKSVPHIAARSPLVGNVDPRDPRRFSYWETKDFTSMYVAFADRDIRTCYNDCLSSQIRQGVYGAFVNMGSMLCAVTGDNRDVARIRAELMTAEELLLWLHDPRLWDVDWFRRHAQVMPGVPDPASVSPSAMAVAIASAAAAAATSATTQRAAQSEAAANAGSGTKRKRPSADEGEIERTMPSAASLTSKQGSPKVAKVTESDEIIATPRSLTLSSGSLTPEDMEAPAPIKEYPFWSGPSTVSQPQVVNSDPLGIMSLPWPKPEPGLVGITNQGLRVESGLVHIPTEARMVRQFALNVLKRAWLEATRPLRLCSCSICNRHREKERIARELAEEKRRQAEMLKQLAWEQTLRRQHHPVFRIPANGDYNDTTTPDDDADDADDDDSFTFEKHEAARKRGDYDKDGKTYDELYDELDDPSDSETEADTPIREIDVDEQLLAAANPRRRESAAPEPPETPELLEDPMNVELEGETEGEPEYPVIYANWGAPPPRKYQPQLLLPPPPPPRIQTPPQLQGAGGFIPRATSTPAKDINPSLLQNQTTTTAATTLEAIDALEAEAFPIVGGAFEKANEEQGGAKSFDWSDKSELSDPSEPSASPYAD